ATAGRLIEYVNAPFAGQPRHVTSVSQGVSLLGAQTSRNILLGFSLISRSTDDRCSSFDYKTYRSETIIRAVLARRLAQTFGGFAPDEVFAVGLLCRIGQFALCRIYPDTYAHLLMEADGREPSCLRKLEREALGIDQNELAAMMMAEWQLAPDYCAAVRHQDSLDDAMHKSDHGELSRILRLSALGAPVLASGSITRASFTSLVKWANRLGIKPDRFAEIFNTTGREIPIFGSIIGLSIRQVPDLLELYARALR
ncbi:HDOD domain-containing protein, partial [bacterium]|nr:HDOD domain-containing protein [bacterium]